MAEEHLSDLIRERRRVLGLSQEQLAEKLNVSRQAVQKWESGKSFPSAERLLELCRVLDIPAEQLLTRAAQQDEAQRKGKKPGKLLWIVFAVGLAFIWLGFPLWLTLFAQPSTGGSVTIEFHFVWTLINLSVLWTMIWGGIVLICALLKFIRK